jgi:hypothetical protein
MDANKLAVLKEIDYKILPCCGLCSYAGLDKGSNWGTCTQIFYNHAKHTGPARALSIHRLGTCPNFNAVADAEVQLHGFAELLQS